MVRLMARKSASLVAVLIAVSALAFLLLSLLPGDPTVAILGTNATPGARAQLRSTLGLDANLGSQYVHYLGRVITGDLGHSYLNGQPVSQAISQRLPATAELLVLAQLLALALAVPLAVLAARHPGGLLDRLSTGVSFGLLSVPYFIIGVLLVLLFAVKLQVLPATGYISFFSDPAGNLRSMLLPAVTLGLGETAGYLRLMRGDLLATLREDFVTVARAKGLPERQVLLRHVLRPSTFSLITLVGLNTGRLIGGAFIIEYLFAIPGIGQLSLNSIYSRDYLMVQGTVLVVAVGYVLVNFAVDLLYTALDPRVRDA